MSGWQGSNRKYELPREYHRNRALVRRRARSTSTLGIEQCEQYTEGVRCTLVGTDCDHAVHRDDHRVEAMQWLCRGHHNAKTSLEAQAGRAARRARRYRPQKKHPGLR